MRRGRRLTLLVLLLGVAGGVAWRWPAVRDALAPRAQVAGIHVASWGWSELELTLDADLANPAPWPVPLDDLPCRLTLGGLDVGTAHLPAGTRLAARATTRVEVPVHTSAEAVAAVLAQSLQRGAVRPYLVQCTPAVALLGRTWTLPVEKRGWVDLTRHELLREDRSPEP
jgi:LEA14-like dessication related protein